MTIASLLAAADATPDGDRLLASLGILLAYLALCVLTVFGRRRHGRVDAGTVGAADRAPVLVAFATQTGFAEDVARRTAHALQDAGMPVRLAPLGSLNGAALATAGRALFVVSTTGEGDGPDAVAGFSRRVMGASAPLAGLRYGVLALGDRTYAQFCAFGHALDGWLRRQDATPLFETIEVDDGDTGALARWRDHLAALGAAVDPIAMQTEPFDDWRLVARRLLNPGSEHPAYQVALEPPQGGAHWQAGDIARIAPRNPPADVAALLDALGLDGDDLVGGAAGPEPLARRLARSRLPRDERAIAGLRGCDAAALAATVQPLPWREYSIASLPGCGRIELLVRQVRHADGRLGVGSGWLTRDAPEGCEVPLRIRENRSFHAPPDDRPVILIGAGTGLAGLRAHLQARAAAGHRRNWLIFGERSSARDWFHRDEIMAWRAQGVIERLDLAFSRDGADRVYVQHRLAAAADIVRRWVDDGAAIFVCGSIDGMAPGVTEALRAALGRERLERMAADGRYRRDVY